MRSLSTTWPWPRRDQTPRRLDRLTSESFMAFSAPAGLALFRLVLFIFVVGWKIYCLDIQGKDLQEDEDLRETIKELQAAGPDNLDPTELEALISKVYQINGKHSYILDLFDLLYRYKDWRTER